MSCPADFAGVLQKYVRDMACRDELVKTDRKDWKRLTGPMTVFRGQPIVDQFDKPNPLSSTRRMFSTSTDRQAATEGFVGTNGMLFVIDLLPGVYVIDVVEQHNKGAIDARDKLDEKEIIVDGGGVFTNCKEAGKNTYRVTYGPRTASSPVESSCPVTAPSKIPMTLAQLKERAIEELGELAEGEPDEYYMDFLDKEHEVFKAGRRRRKNGTKRARKRKGSTRRR